MATVPPDNLQQLLGQHRVKLIVVGDPGSQGRNATIAANAEAVVPNGPGRVAIWVKDANAVAGIAQNCDVAVLSPTNALVRTEQDNNPLDLTAPFVLDGLFNLGAGAN